jgi:hypothetical protein
MIRARVLLVALLGVGCSHSTASAGNDGNEAGYPACSGDLEAGAPCDLSAPECFNCASGNGLDCSCTTNGALQNGVEPADAAIWWCVGTGYTCQ